MSSIESQSLSDSEENSVYRSNPRRNKTKLQKLDPDENQETEDGESEEIENDRESDEDFSLVNKPKKNKKKRKEIVKNEEEKLKRKLKKKGNFAPSFEDVLMAQFQKHDQKYVNFEEDEEDYNSEEEEPIGTNMQQYEDESEALREKSPSPKPLDPVVAKKRKIIIYPWRPIGITGGRFPVNDVRALNDIDPYTHSDYDDNDE